MRWFVSCLVRDKWKEEKKGSYIICLVYNKMIEKCIFCKMTLIQTKNEM